MVGEVRSQTMRAVRSKDTKPELIVRQLVTLSSFDFACIGKICLARPIWFFLVGGK